MVVGVGVVARGGASDIVNNERKVLELFFTALSLVMRLENMGAGCLSDLRGAA